MSGNRIFGLVHKELSSFVESINNLFLFMCDIFCTKNDLQQKNNKKSEQKMIIVTFFIYYLQILLSYFYLA